MVREAIRGATAGRGRGDDRGLRQFNPAGEFVDKQSSR
jgi:hypothetical protein